MAHQIVSRLLILCVCCISIALSGLDPLWAGPYFDDGYLGLPQTELHEKLGLPQAVRDRKSALRVFTYYPISDWDQYFKKVVSPENGEDVYTFKREGIDVHPEIMVPLAGHVNELKYVKEIVDRIADAVALFARLLHPSLPTLAP